MSPCVPSLVPLVLQRRCELLHPWCGARQGCCTHSMRAPHAQVPTVWSQPGLLQAVWSCVGLKFCGASAPITWGWTGPRLWGAPVLVWGQQECVPGRAVRNGFPQPAIDLTLTGFISASVSVSRAVWEHHPCPRGLAVAPTEPPALAAFSGASQQTSGVIQHAGYSLGSPLRAGLWSVG